MKNNTARIFGLDVMRAIAITMVVLSHTGYIFQGYRLPGMKLLGLEGVELFFVLSGFLIGGILLRLITTTSFSKKIMFHFWIRRWFRTLPLYYLMLLVNIFIAILVGYKLPNDLWKYVFFLQNFNKYHIPFFPESWSLSIEEFAYFLAPICLYVLCKLFKKIKNKDKLFLWTSVLLVLLFLVAKISYHAKAVNALHSLALWNSKLKPIVIYRLDSIFYGFILVYYFNKYKKRIDKLKDLLFFLGVFLIGLLFIIMPMLGIVIEKTPFYWNVMLLPLNSIAIGFLLPKFYFLKEPRPWLSKIIKNISIYSYAMYLLHYTFVLYLMQLLLDFSSLSMFECIVCTFIYLIITYLFSKVVYNYFEKPMTNLRDDLRIKYFFNT
ncbi:acyltransferase family protein [Aestuariivivens marinum]|uniref:acyltransferase family protein n=1 Tax=Aestuariivivens marinum TaxID=2913555 RepID=UPI001F5A9BA3|nr:acyltransferase [Aestuariivivens marinum]